MYVGTRGKAVMVTSHAMLWVSVVVGVETYDLNPTISDVNPEPLLFLAVHSGTQ